MKYYGFFFFLFLFPFLLFAQNTPQTLASLDQIQALIRDAKIKTAQNLLLEFEKKHPTSTSDKSLANQTYATLQAHLQIEKEVFDIADAWIKKALMLSKLHQDSISHCIYTHEIARNFYEKTSQYDKAIEQSNILIPFLEKKGALASLSLSRVYRKIGFFYAEKTQTDKALDYLNKSLALLDKSSNVPPIDLANLYRTFAMSYFKAREYDKQLLYLNKAFGVCQKENSHESKRLQIAILSNLGGYYIRNGQNQKGLASYKKFLEETILEYGEQHANTASAYMNYAIAFAQSGDYSASEVNFRKSIDIKTQIFGLHNPNVALGYGNLVVLLNLLGRHKDALQASQNSFVANCVGYSDTNCYVDLVPIVQKHQLLDPINVIGNLNNRSNAFHLLYEEHGDINDLKQAHQSVLAQVAVLDKIKNDLSDQDKIKVLSREFMPFHQGVYYAHLLYQKTKEKRYLEEGFQLAERSKDAVLTSALNSKKALNLGGIPDSLIQKENSLKEDISSLEKKLLNTEKSDSFYHDYQEELFALKQEKEKFSQELEKNYPKYFQLKYTSSIASIKNIQDEILTEEKLFLSYYISAPMVYIWAIGPNQTNFLSFELDSAYTNDVAEFRKVLTDLRYTQKNPKKALANYVRLSYKFYEQFLAPALQNSSAKHLILVPDHLLGHLPFEAFTTKKLKQAELNYQNLPYLIKQFEIQYSYSASLLLQNKQQYNRIATNVELFALAAEYDKKNIITSNRTDDDIKLRKHLIPLPEAINEVKELESMFDGKFLYGKPATEKAFKNNLSNYGVIHLAMHGLLNAANPIASSLAFTEDGDAQEDNFLHASEISNLQLNAQLVVLSACETGYGKFERGEGIMSLARSFMHAGVPSLVVSLWQVNDYSTSKIMALFYQGLKEGLSKSEALRQAKLTYINSAKDIAAHPALWAAFVQLGNEEALDLNKNSLISLRNGLLILALLLFIGGLYWKRKNS